MPVLRLSRCPLPCCTRPSPSLPCHHQVRNFLEPQSLEGLSVGTMLLALTGNVMMLPRALFTRDTVWTAGTSWGSAAGWGQLLSMFLATSPTTG